MAQINLQLAQVAPTAVRLQHDEFQVIVDRPIDKGGSGKGLMGGQYLLLGVGGCFCSTLFAAAQARKVLISGLNVKVKALISEEQPKRFTDIELEVSYEQCSEPDTFEKLLAIAEKGCLSMNTVKNGLNVRVTV